MLISPHRNDNTGLSSIRRFLWVQGQREDSVLYRIADDKQFVLWVSELYLHEPESLKDLFACNGTDTLADWLMVFQGANAVLDVPHLRLLSQHTGVIFHLYKGDYPGTESLLIDQVLPENRDPIVISVFKDSQNRLNTILPNQLTPQQKNVLIPWVMAGNLEHQQPIPWCSIYNAEYYFSREDRIKEIFERLANQKEGIRELALVGASKTGKKELAMDMASRFIKDGTENPRFAYVINTQSILSMLGDCESLAENLGVDIESYKLLYHKIDAPDKERAFITMLMQAIQTQLLNYPGRWMLIFTGVEKRERIAPFIPALPGLDGYVIYLSQNVRFLNDARCINLNKGMTDEQAVQFLEHLTHLNDPEGALKLANYLDNLPYALVCAGGYIAWQTYSKRSECSTYQSYLQRHQNNLSFLDRDQHSVMDVRIAYRSLFDIFSESMSGLSQNSQRLLQLCSLLGNRRMPIVLLRRFNQQLSECVSPSQDDFEVVSDELFSQGLITPESDATECIYIHKTTLQILWSELNTSEKLSSSILTVISAFSHFAQDSSIAGSVAETNLYYYLIPQALAFTAKLILAFESSSFVLPRDVTILLANFACQWGELALHHKQYLAAKDLFAFGMHLFERDKNLPIDAPDLAETITGGFRNAEAQAVGWTPSLYVPESAPAVALEHSVSSSVPSISTSSIAFSSSVSVLDNAASFAIIKGNKDDKWFSTLRNVLWVQGLEEHPLYALTDRYAFLDFVNDLHKRGSVLLQDIFDCDAPFRQFEDWQRYFARSNSPVTNSHLVLLSRHCGVAFQFWKPSVSADFQCVFERGLLLHSSGMPLENSTVINLVERPDEQARFECIIFNPGIQQIKALIPWLQDNSLQSKNGMVPSRFINKLPQANVTSIVREGKLMTMFELLRSQKNERKILVLNGAHGSGKKELAVQFAQQYLHIRMLYARAAHKDTPVDPPFVYFINASPETCLSEMEEFGRQLRIDVATLQQRYTLASSSSTKHYEKILAEKIHYTLQSYSDWLLIFDGANIGTQHIFQWVPRMQGHQGTVLFLSESALLCGMEKNQFLDLSEGMTAEESLCLLEQLTGLSDKEAALALANSLERQPLALQLAGHQIRKQRSIGSSSGFDYSSYLSQYQNQFQQLEEEQSKTCIDILACQTPWQILERKIGQLSLHERNLLIFCCLVDDNGIPDLLLKTWCRELDIGLYHSKLSHSGLVYYAGSNLSLLHLQRLTIQFVCQNLMKPGPRFQPEFWQTSPNPIHTTAFIKHAFAAFNGARIECEHLNLEPYAKAFISRYPTPPHDTELQLVFDSFKAQWESPSVAASSVLQDFVD